MPTFIAEELLRNRISHGGLDVWAGVYTWMPLAAMVEHAMPQGFAGALKELASTQDVEQRVDGRAMVCPFRRRLCEPVD